MNGFQYSGQISIHIAIPKTKDAEAGTGQFVVASLILCGMKVQIMLAAINSHNKPVLQANEIDEVAFAGRLATKMKTELFP